MFNTVVLTGRLTADPELKTTQSGISVTSFCIAVDRPYKSGEEKQTDFISIVAWRKTAEFVTRYFKKGDMIGIEGRIQTRKYTDRDGNQRSVFEVAASNIQFVESKRDSVTSSETAAGAAASHTDSGAKDFTDIGEDDDLPF